MPPDRRFRPAGPEPLEPRAVLSPTVIVDLDTGSFQLPSWPPNYGLPPVTLYPYLTQEFDARGATVVPTSIGDTGGYGSHGTMMSGLAAAYSLLRGSPVAVQPIVVGTMAGADSNAIGRALFFAVAEKQSSPQFNWIVTIPWSRGYHGPLETQGRKVAARAGLTVIDSADIPPHAVPVPSLGTSGAAMFAAVNAAMNPTIFGRAVPRPSRWR